MHQATVGGLGDLYTVTDKHVEGQEPLHHLWTQGDYQNYQQLQGCRLCDRRSGRGCSGPDFPLIVGDPQPAADEVTNNQQLTVTGNVKGSFDSVARGSSGRTEHFQFD